MTRALPDWVKPGVSFRDETSPCRDSWEVWHIRAIVDGRAVMRLWRREKRRWEYEVQGWIFFRNSTRKFVILKRKVMGQP